MDAISLSQLEFYLTPEHDCSYLPGKQAMTLFADPHLEIGTELYSKLIQYGFRRSGKLVYRPRCPLCDACVPLRIPVQQFRSNRSQRRNWNSNHDIAVEVRPATFTDEHFALYLEYIRSRHTGGGMDNDDPHRYRDFLLNPYLDVRFHEFRLDGRLVAAAVTDYLEEALSAVYTYFDPALNSLGLGNFAILNQIHTAQQLKLKYLYLGYWIAESDKMAYKSGFQPHETFRDGHWRANNPL